MKGPEKDAVMAAFASGRIGVLVATTVIEVGVDVPNATLIVIEHADRFGLFALPGDERRQPRAGRALRVEHQPQFRGPAGDRRPHPPDESRSEEHTSELQSLMRISYAVFCLKKKINTHNNYDHT